MEKLFDRVHLVRNISGCFLVLSCIVAVYKFGTDLLSLLFLQVCQGTLVLYAGILLSAIGLFLGNRKIMTLGCFISLLGTLYGYCPWILDTLRYGGDWNDLFWSVSPIVVFIMAVIAYFLQGKISIVASCLCGICMLIHCLTGQKGVAQINPLYSIFCSSMLAADLLLACGFITMGFALVSVPGGNEIVPSAKKDGNTKQKSIYNQVERLLQLKALLDKGVISQEEFDKKKQEIIGE